MSKHTGKVLMAGIIGVIAGAISGLLFAPKSGEETRKDIKRMAKKISDDIKMEAGEAQKRTKEVFGQVTKTASEKYQRIRDEVVNKIAAVKKAGETIDKDKYMMIVGDVITEFKEDLEMTKEGAVKMKDQFIKDWGKVRKALEGEITNRPITKKQTITKKQ